MIRVGVVMRLKCKNIGKLQSADIDINTITVIAGLNSTGKSTIGKLLYSIFNSSHDIKIAIEQNLLLIISRYLESSLFGLTTNTQKIKKCSKEILAKRDNPNKDEIREIILSFMGNDFLDEKKESFIESLIEILNIPDDVIYKNLLQNKLNYEFDKQIQNFSKVDEEAFVSLKIIDKEINVFLEKNEVKSINNLINLTAEAIYIDDPFVLDTLNISRNIYNGHKGDLCKKLRQNTFLESDIESVISELVLTKKIDKIYSKINTACNGNIVLDMRTGFNFLIDSSKESLRLVNISTGLKAFAIIKTLLLNGALEQKGVLILDEPEIHLHPEWQKILAEVIVLIQKEFEMHILINSHSPYFINAIDVYAQKYKIRESCKFYLAKDIENKEAYISELLDVSDNLEEINKLLFIPLQELENERAMIEDDNE